jgi:putative holliday junction resolvase
LVNRHGNILAQFFRSVIEQKAMHLRIRVAGENHPFAFRGKTYNSAVSAPENQAHPQLRPRILGLDVGSKTIGLAVSDPLGITAQGLETMRRQNKRRDLGQLEALIRQYEVAEIVVGYPLRMSGLEGTQSEKMRVFAEGLRQRFHLPVHLWDERLSSAEANRVLRDSEMSIQRRGEVVDRLAAVLILQSWLDTRANGMAPQPEP